MKSVVRNLISCLLLLSSTHLSAQGVLSDLLKNFHVITGDYQARGGVEGAVFVHGSYLPDNWPQFGFNGGMPANDSANMLWLNNGVGNGNTSTLLSGSLISRTDVNSAQFNLNGNAPGSPSISTGETAWNQALDGIGLSSVGQLTALLADASSQWSSLTSNSTGSTPGNGSYTFNATPTVIDGRLVAVFNVTSADIFDAGNFDRLELLFNNNYAETILINVSGTNINVNKNFTNGFTNNESKILFNFYEATSITVNSAFSGTIFAPFADVTHNGSQINGTIVSKSLNQSSYRGIHKPGFTGYLPYTPISVPEPSVVLFSLLGAGFALRRRR